MNIKDKIIEEMNFNDLNLADHNIQGALEIIENNVMVSNDDMYIFDTWNDIHEIERLTGLKIDSILDNYGFSDEYVLCDICCNAIHTNTYCQLPDYWLNDYEFTCGDCIRDCDELIDEYIEHLVNNPKNANILLTDNDLIDKGFKVCSCDDKECLFTAGWNWHDDPKEILKNAIKENPGKDFIFSINSIGQFDLDYTIYHRSKE